MLPFENGLQYRNCNFKRFDRMNFSTLFTILVAFGPETTEFTLLTIAPFAAILQNQHITQNISECRGPTLTYFTGLVGVLMGMIMQIFVWRSPNGRCYGNQLNMGDVCKSNVLWNDVYSLLQHSTTDWPIVNPLSRVSVAIIRLHCVHIW